MDEPENYKRNSLGHTIADWKYEQWVKTINDDATCWIRMLQAGQKHKHEKRIKSNFVNNDMPVAPLYTLRKDHKSSVSIIVKSH